MVCQSVQHIRLHKIGSVEIYAQVISFSQVLQTLLTVCGEEGFSLV